MLKNPYVSRVFGHLFDLVRLVMRSEWHKTDSTARTSTLVILPLTETVPQRTAKQIVTSKEKPALASPSLFIHKTYTTLHAILYLLTKSNFLFIKRVRKALLSWSTGIK